MKFFFRTDAHPSAATRGLLSFLLFGLLVSGFVLGALLVSRRIGRRSYVPFGPFLIIGLFWAVLVRG